MGPLKSRPARIHPKVHNHLAPHHSALVHRQVTVHPRSRERSPVQLGYHPADARSQAVPHIPTVHIAAPAYTPVRKPAAQHSRRAGRNIHLAGNSIRRRRYSPPRHKDVAIRQDTT